MRLLPFVGVGLAVAGFMLSRKSQAAERRPDAPAGGRGVGVSGGAGRAAGEGLTGYVPRLAATFAAHRAELASWDKAKLMAAAMSAADAAGIPRAALAAVVGTEAGWQPVGVHGQYLKPGKGDDGSKAIAAKSTAFGVGQVIWATFVKAAKRGGLTFDHADCWDPAKGLQAAAWALRLAFDAAGGDPARAFNVYATGKPAPSPKGAAKLAAMRRIAAQMA